MTGEYLTEKRFLDFESRLWERFDRNDDLSRSLGERIAVVEALANTNEKRIDTMSAETKKTATKWGAGVGTAAGAMIYTAFQMFFSKGSGQ